MPETRYVPHSIIQPGFAPILTCAERHYSYECKSAPQERPYIARPSRTQQLSNPKLLPKLASDTPNFLQEKEGVADQELAKREAERARQRQREEDDDAALREASPARRDQGRRSPSYDSVSSISTRSPSPVPQRRSHSPSRRGKQRDSRSPSPRLSSHRGRGREPSYDSDDRYSRGPSESPERGYPARNSRPPRSLSPRRSPSPRRDYGGRSRRDTRSRRDYSRSRSPVARDDRGGREGDRHGAGRYRERDDEGYQGRRRSPSPVPAPPRRPSPPRERSLSPFSKRLALTQSMNMGR
ncbi:uncharacterized protein C8A04DRAFT_28085 [Dichotomopilus funicola]|uniref:Uncharacterized protein n=1 Tax=Dichotomopilus funicola TaxID=1934379 RepID=A0AAN6V3F8_9PEZI|nr:hypothetical protein C8A04DRAFT_28085 [Dichotomopilus funicola]